jgi:hypothetical protein
MRILVLLVVLVTVLAAAVYVAAASANETAGAGDPAAAATRWDDCGLLGVGPADEPACLDEERPARASRDGLPPTCRMKVEAVFWTFSDWLRLGEALAADPAPCAEYWISLPPANLDKKRLRFLQDDLIRALGPQFHPVAEMTLSGSTGWAAWVQDTGSTWFQAGVEFRRRMAEAGYDVAAGETWLLNEFDRTTRTDATTRPGGNTEDGPAPPFRRADMRDLVRGLYYGDVGMPTSAGIAEIGINFSHQNLPDVAQYKTEMQAWLEDTGFWADMSRYVRFLAREAYPDVRLWAPPGSSRNERRRHLEDYIFHLLELARSGPPSVETARAYLEQAYVPLVNGGYRARGGDQFNFTTGHGNTIVSTDEMLHFVSEQVYAIRHYAGAHPQGAPAGRLGFSWQPCNRTSATQAGCGAFNATFQRALDAITARIASAIHYAYREGGASPVGACRPPGEELDFCDGQLPGAQFTDAWGIFDSWG